MYDRLFRKNVCFDDVIQMIYTLKTETFGLSWKNYSAILINGAHPIINRNLLSCCVRDVLSSYLH